MKTIIERLKLARFAALAFAVLAVGTAWGATALQTTVNNDGSFVINNVNAKSFDHCSQNVSSPTLKIPSSTDLPEGTKVYVDTISIGKRTDQAGTVPERIKITALGKEYTSAAKELGTTSERFIRDGSSDYADKYKYSFTDTGCILEVGRTYSIILLNASGNAISGTNVLNVRVAEDTESLFGDTVKYGSTWRPVQEITGTKIVSIGTATLNMTESMNLSDATFDIDPKVPGGALKVINNTGDLALTIDEDMANMSITFEGTGNTTLVIGNDVRFVAPKTFSKSGSGSVIVRVDSGATCEIDGCQQFLTTPSKFILNGGSLVNNGADIGDGKQQITNLELTADSLVGGTSSFGMIGSGYAATTLTLNGHTLTVNNTGGNKLFMVDSVETDDGLIKIKQGVFGCYKHNDSARQNTFNCTIQLDNDYYNTHTDISYNGGSYGYCEFFMAGDGSQPQVKNIFGTNGRGGNITGASSTRVLNVYGTLSLPYAATITPNVHLLDGATVKSLTSAGADCPSNGLNVESGATILVDVSDITLSQQTAIFKWTADTKPSGTFVFADEDLRTTYQLIKRDTGLWVEKFNSRATINGVVTACSSLSDAIEYADEDTTIDLFIDSTESAVTVAKDATISLGDKSATINTLTVSGNVALTIAGPGNFRVDRIDGDGTLDLNVVDGADWIAPDGITLASAGAALSVKTGVTLPATPTTSIDNAYIKVETGGNGTTYSVVERVTITVPNVAGATISSINYISQGAEASATTSGDYLVDKGTTVTVVYGATDGYIIPSGTINYTASATGAIQVNDGFIIDNRTSTWNPTDGNAWSTAANWSTGYVPTQYTVVTFNDEANVELDGNVTIAGAEVNGSVAITATATQKSLNSIGNITGNGTLTLSDVCLASAKAGGIAVGEDVDVNFTNDSELARTAEGYAGVTLNGDVTISDTFKVWNVQHNINGTLTINSGASLTLGSDLFVNGAATVKGAFTRSNNGCIKFFSQLTIEDGAVVIDGSGGNFDDKVTVVLARASASVTDSRRYPIADNKVSTTVAGSYVKKVVNGYDNTFSVETYKIVTFVDEDGTTVLQTVGNLRIGDTPAYTEATPTKAATAQYTYTFTGWDDGTTQYGPTDALPAVTGAAEYTATYSSTVNNYKVTIPTVEHASTVVVTVGDDVIPLADGGYTVPYGSTVTITYTADEGYFFGTSKTKVVEIASVEGDTAVPAEQAGSTTAAVAQLMPAGSYYPSIDAAYMQLYLALINEATAYLQVLDSEAETPNIYGAGNIGYDANARRYAKAVAKVVDTADYYPAYTTLQDAIDDYDVVNGRTISLLVSNSDSVTLANNKSVTILASDPITYNAPVAAGDYTVDAGETVEGVTTYAARDWYTWTLELGTHPNATVTDLPVAVSEGDAVADRTVSFTVTAEATYKVTAVKVDGVAQVGNNGTYTYTVSGDATVTVETELDVKTFTVVVPANTTVTVTGESVVDNGDGTYTATIGDTVTITYTVTGQFVGETQQQVVEITGDTVSIPTPGNYVAPVPAVAQVGTTYFADFASALAAVPAQGDTVTLLAPLALSSTVTLDKSMTLNLNGFDVTATDCRAFHVTAGAFEITGEGVVSATATEEMRAQAKPSFSSSSSVIRVGSDTAETSFTLGENVTVASDWCYGVSYFGTKHQTVVIDGTVAVTGAQAAISGNGLAKYNTSEGGTTLVVNGTVTAMQDYAIYNPQTGTTTINGTVTGLGGIEVKAGTVTVNDGAVITATAQTQSHTTNNNGTSTVGYAIASVGNVGYQGEPTVTITGGTIAGQAVVLADQATADNGTITATSNEIAAPADYKWVETATAGVYELVEKVYVAEVNGQGYETFAEALAAAGGKTLKLLAPLALSSTVTLDKSVTLDLNGFDVTATDCRAFHVTAGTVAFTGTGTVSTVVTPGTSFSKASSVIRVGSDTAVTSFTLGAGVTVASDYCYGITYFGREAQTVTIDGTVAVTGAQAAISGNGNSWNAPVTLTVNGTVTATQDYAIYNPQRGTTTINGTVTGLGGIEMKAGTLTVGANAAITATAQEQAHSTNNNGTSTTGYAIASVGNAAYPGDPVVTINGGTIAGKAIVLAENGAEEAGTIVATVATISTDPDYKWVEGDTAGTYKLVAKTYVAEVGGQGYETFASALAAAETGDTVTLLADIDVTSAMYSGDTRFNLWINKSLTIDGDGHTLTVKGRGIGVQGTSSNIDVVFKEMTVQNVGNANGRCIDTRGKLNRLTLDGVTLTTATSSYTGYLQPLTIGGNQSTAATVTIKDSVIETVAAANKGYAITTFNPVTMTVTDSTIRGWACLNIKGPDSSAGSSGSTIVVTGSTLVSANGTPGTTNSFSLIKIEDDNVSVSVTESTINVNGGANTQSIVSFQKLNETNSANCTVALGAGNTVTLEGTYKFASNVDASSALAISGGTFNVAVPEEFCATGYIPTYDSTTGTYGVEAGEYSVYIGEDCYETLEDALADAEDGATLKVVRDIEVTSTVVIDKSVTIDLNGNNIVATNVRALWVKAGTVELTGEGTISANGDGLGATSSVIRVGDGADNTALAKLTVGEGVTVSTAKSYGITTFGKNTLGIELELYGKVIVTSTGKADAAISGNGSKGLASTTITVKEGAVVSAANGAGIYFPGAGTLTVEGGSITGPTAVYVKSGNVKISGGELTGNGEETAYTYTGDGLKATGDALVVESCGYPNGAPTALVTGGTLVSDNAKAIGCYATTGNSVPKNIVPAKVNGAINPARFGDADAMGIAAGYKLVADGNLFKVARVENTVAGTVDVVSVSDTTLVTVPANCNADQLINTTNRAEGDILKAYVKSAGRYFTWKLENIDNDPVWTPVQTWLVGANPSDSTKPAAEVQLKKGEAVWVTRVNSSEPVLVNGSYAETQGASTVTVETGYNLVAPVPTATEAAAAEVVINEVVEKSNNTVNDKILVPPTESSAPVALNCKYNESTKKHEWGYDFIETYTDDDGNLRSRKVRKTDVKIPSGTGFWYISGGNKEISL